MEHDVFVLTPEKTILSFQLSGVSARIRAHLLDILIIFTVLFVVILAVSLSLSAYDPAIGKGLSLFIVFAWPLAYFIGLEALNNGQTLGKKAFRLRVRMADGTPVTFEAALGRNLLRPADILPGPYFVGLLAIFTTSKGQRLGDLVAGTIVCQEPPPVPNFTITPHAAGLHPLESYVGSLSGMTIEEYNALRLFADRFPELPRPIQDKLVEEVWKAVAERRQVPSYSNIHPIYLAEAVVMKFGREKGLL